MREMESNKSTIRDDSNKIQIHSISEITELQREYPSLLLAERVMTKGYPNRYGARIPIETKWDLDSMEHMLHKYHDKEVVQWLRYGWPSGRLPTLGPPAWTATNHTSAVEFPQQLTAYIKKEAALGAVIGPFQKIPFNINTHKVGISPLSTRAKKLSTDRRILIDLSFPPGAAVNDGMIRNNYMGMEVKLTFPRTDDLAKKIYEIGRNTYMWKVDLSRYFRQIGMDPGDYALIGYVINNQIWFDKMVPMGMRTGPYIAQRTSNAIAWIHRQMMYYILNYVDDFLGAEDGLQTAKESFEHFCKLLIKINIDMSAEKQVEPTTRIEFLGNLFDSKNMTIEIPPEKLQEVKMEISIWMDKTYARQKELESIIGKLQFVARCVRQGQIFVARLLNWLKGLEKHGLIEIPQEVKRDLTWWNRYLQEYNGISILWLHTSPEDEWIITTDASLTGYGGVSGCQYFRGTFPEHIRCNNNITQLEMYAVLAAVRVWADKFRGRYFWVEVDNQAVMAVLNSGAAHNETLQILLREIAYIAATHQFIIKAKYINTEQNKLPDRLSQWKEAKARKEFWRLTRGGSYKRIKIHNDILKCEFNW